ncbi:hypothetical protein KIW84_074459 [Lathyrus oleraceus]|uniref:Uncharacterized protein n=1 Tax=Pisum sativum TaxID=3888 RepID=A0A9D4VSW9_PEA|nr:hypothetical protein KIW84_074459 [Pisum sativum]
MQTAYELLPESGKVVSLDVDFSVKQAFRILHEQGVPMAPLGDFCKGQFGGVLSILDLYFNFKRARESWVFAKGVDAETVVLMMARASRLENQDAIDTAIVVTLADPREARAGV